MRQLVIRGGARGEGWTGRSPRHVQPRKVSEVVFARSFRLILDRQQGQLELSAARYRTGDVLTDGQAKQGAADRREDAELACAAGVPRTAQGEMVILAAARLAAVHARVHGH